MSSQGSIQNEDDEEQEFGLTLSEDLVSPQPVDSGAKMMDKPLMEFPINVECTSLCISPSGNFVWGGFSDGTIRVFDTSGKFCFDENDDEKLLAPQSNHKAHLFVSSKWCQSFGAVACQIHARGVHTDLLTHVAMAEEEFIFGGVQRGATEVYAIDVKELERTSRKMRQSWNKELPISQRNILDCIKVHVHSDAKLKGFGACTKLQHTPRPAYLLLTGTGIKNIHIWKFQPPLHDCDSDAIWEQLYDTQTNGNTINFLSFYREPQSRKLWGVSKSDKQKLRLWDLTSEEHPNSKPKQRQRPKRPPYQDVANSHAALGTNAGFCVCGGGPTMYNQVSIVSLDQPKSAYNHTELELPGIVSASSRGRRRGNLKQVSNVAISPEKPHHALLELDDGSLVHYSATGTKLVSPANSGIPDMPADFWKRTMCLGSISCSNSVFVAMSLYNPNTQQGRIVVRRLAKGSPGCKVLTPEKVGIQEPKTSGLSSCIANQPEVLESLSSCQDSVKLVNTDQHVSSKKLKRKATASPPTMTSNVPATLPTPKKKKRRRIVAEDEGTPPKDDSTALTSCPSPSSSGTSTSKQSYKQEESFESESAQQEHTDENMTVVLDVKAVNSARASKVPTEQKDTSPLVVLTPTTYGPEEVDIKKLLQPKRVLHQWSDQQYQECKQGSDEKSDSVSVTIEPRETPNIAPAARVASNAVGAISFDYNKESLKLVKKKTKPIILTNVPKKSNSIRKLYMKKVAATSHFVASAEFPNKTNKERKIDDNKALLEEKRLKKERKLKHKLKIQRMEQAVFDSVRKAEIHDDDIKEPTRELGSDQCCSKDKHLRKKSKPHVIREKVCTDIVGATVVKKDSVEPHVTVKQKIQTDGIDIIEIEADSKDNKFNEKIRTMSYDSEDLISVKSDLRFPQTVSHVCSPATSIEASPARYNSAREAIFMERVATQYEILLVRLNEARGDSRKDLKARFSRMSMFSEGLGSDDDARSKLASEHRAAHVMIRKRLLQAAESALRLVIDTKISIDEARSDLQASINSYEEVLYNTIKRQEFEASSLASRQAASSKGKIAPEVKVFFPFYSDFQIVQEIYDAIEPPKRMAGRPRNCKSVFC